MSALMGPTVTGIVARHGCRSRCALGEAGYVVAEVSVPNPNVYYEIGLADALGKDIFLFKQHAAQVPADFGGVHYYPYDRGDLAQVRTMLAGELQEWAAQASRQPLGVKTLEDARPAS